MAITNLDKETTTRLFKMLHLNDDNNIELIKNNYSSFSQLKILSEQIENLYNKADEIFNNCKLNNKLNSIPMLNKKIPGTIYYHYKFTDKEILSIIGPDEWSTYTEYFGKYLYDYDNIFYAQH